MKLSRLFSISAVCLAIWGFSTNQLVELPAKLSHFTPQTLWRLATSGVTDAYAVGEQLNISAPVVVGGSYALSAYKFQDQTNSAYYLSPAASDYSLLTAGKVGIGTTGPSYKLDVTGDIRATGAVYANTSGKYFQGGDDASLNDINVANTIGVYGAQNTTLGSIKLGSGGGTISGYNSSVGIGTLTPGATLDVAGSMRFSGAGYIRSTSPTIFFQDSDERSSAIHQNGTVLHFLSGSGVDGTSWTVNGSWWPLTINMNTDAATFGGPAYFVEGNVGIGTTSPYAKLHVIGTGVYTIPNTFSGAGQNASWTTGFTTQAMPISILTSGPIVSGGGVYAASDERLKKNIHPLEGEIVDRFFNTAKPVDFNWIENSNQDSGFIAQDFIKNGLGYLVSTVPDDALKESVNKDGITSPAGTKLVVNYSSIVPILTAKIQQQQTQIDSLQSQIDTLKKLINEK